MHIPSSMLVMLPQIQASIVQFLYILCTYWVSSRLGRWCASLTGRSQQKPNIPTDQLVEKIATPSRKTVSPHPHRRPPVTVSTAATSCGPPIGAVVSRKGSTNLGTSTKSVDVLSRPPISSSRTHRRCASLYSETCEYGRIFNCVVKAIRRHERSSVNSLLTSLSTEGVLNVLKKRDSQQGFSAMHYAVQERQYELAEEILEALPDPTARADLCASPGDTVNCYAPIHIAALRGDCDIICLLLRNGASPNATSKLCATPLHLAASKGHTAACRLLLEHGSYVNAATKTGNTALMSAVHNRSLEMVQLLVEFGANPKITTQSGLNALSLALSLNATEILLVLEGSVKKHGHRRTSSSTLI